MSDRVGKPVINIVTGFLHIYPCPHIHQENKKLENWITFDTLQHAKEYAKLAEIKLKPCGFCAMEAYYV